MFSYKILRDFVRRMIIISHKYLKNSVLQSL
nr:MAG TPA: hypothetical protein [Caudoviricetes sp.]